jgi:hypothetical protein
MTPNLLYLSSQSGRGSAPTCEPARDEVRMLEIFPLVSSVAMAQRSKRLIALTISGFACLVETITCRGRSARQSNVDLGAAPNRTGDTAFGAMSETPRNDASRSSDRHMRYASIRTLPCSPAACHRLPFTPSAREPGAFCMASHFPQDSAEDFPLKNSVPSPLRSTLGRTSRQGRGSTVPSCCPVYTAE